MEPEELPPRPTPISIPVDPRTVAWSFLGKWPWALGILVLAGVVGYAASQSAASRLFKAETIMLYDAASAAEDGQSQSPSLFTEIALIKLPVHIEALREKLKISATIDRIAAAAQVTIQPKTALVSLTVQWDDAKLAMEMANGLRDIFLESRQQVHRSRILGNIEVLNRRLDPVKQELTKADSRLETYAKANQIVNLTEEAKALLQEQMTLNVFYGQAVAEREVALKQAKEVQEVIRNVQERVAQEAREAAAHTDALSETNIRIQRLRESISDDQKMRVEGARLREKRLAAERARTALESRALSKADYDLALMELRVQEALTLETTQTQEWKGQIKELDQRVIPSQAGNSSSGNLLLAVLIREFEINMQAISVEQKVEQLDQARMRVSNRLSRIPEIEREYVSLQRTVTSLEAEVTGLEGALALARKELELRGVRFSTIVEAKLPIRPSKSNTKLLFAAGIAGTALLGFLALVGFVVYRLRLGSALELNFWTGKPALGELPRGMRESELRWEYYHLMAERLKELLGPEGRVLLLAGAHPSARTGAVAMDLGRALSYRGERVVVVAADLRNSGSADLPAAPPEQDLEKWMNQPDAATLASYLLTVAGTEVHYLGWASHQGGTPRALRPAMAQLIEVTRGQFDRVIIVGPAMEPWADGKFLASQCDGSALVAHAGACSYFQLQRAAKVLTSSPTPFLGTILADVSPSHLSQRFDQSPGSP
jgi:Mrp family chromosome partitioning ATPase